MLNFSPFVFPLLLQNGEKSSGVASRGYTGSNLFDPENPDYSIDLSDSELNNELEDDHEC